MVAHLQDTATKHIQLTENENEELVEQISNVTKNPKTLQQKPYLQ